MPIDIQDKFREGDLVTNGENTGRVYRNLNRRTREYFLTVKVTEGPDKVKVWDHLWRGYRPLIDWKDGTVMNECERCDRKFLSRPNVLSTLGNTVVPLDSYCTTCAPIGRQIKEQQARDAGSLGESARARDWNASRRR